MKKVFKSLFIAALLSATITTNAQPYIGISANNRGFGIQAGGLIAKLVDVNILYNSKITNSSTTPCSFTANAGLRLILSDDETTKILLTPAIGFSNTRYEDFSEEHIAPQYRIIEVKEKRINYSLELAKERNDVRIFLSGSHGLKTYVAAGVKVFITGLKK